MHLWLAFAVDDFAMPLLLSGLRIFRPKPIGETRYTLVVSRPGRGEL
jgi:hypothetical protein